MEQLRHTHSMTTDFRVPVVEIGDAVVRTYAQPAQRDIEQYQAKDYPQWIERVRAQLANLHERLTHAGQFFDATVTLSNTGNAPATDALIEFWLSEGLSFHHPIKDQRKRLRLPPLPAPPRPPRGHASLSAFGPQGALHSARNLADLSHLVHRPVAHRRDPNEFYYKPIPYGTATEHTLECEVFRHQLEPEPFPFLISVAGDVHGGQLACRVSATNLKTPVLVKFPFKVEYTPGDSTSIARQLVSHIGQADADDSP